MREGNNEWNGTFKLNGPYCCIFVLINTNLPLRIESNAHRVLA